MKIVFVTECLGSGGAERQMVNLAIMMKIMAIQSMC